MTMPLGLLISCRTSPSSSLAKPQLLKVQVHLRSVENTKHHAFTEHRRKYADAKIDRMPLHLQPDTAVLRQTPLRDVEIRHNLDTGTQRHRDMLGRRHHLIQRAVDTIPHFVLIFKRLEMDVRCLVADRLQKTRFKSFFTGFDSASSFNSSRSILWSRPSNSARKLSPSTSPIRSLIVSSSAA